MRGSRAVRRAGRTASAVLAGLLLTAVMATPASAGDGSIWNFAPSDSQSQVNSDGDGSIWN